MGARRWERGIGSEALGARRPSDVLRTSLATRSPEGNVVIFVSGERMGSCTWHTERRGRVIQSVAVAFMAAAAAVTLVAAVAAAAAAFMVVVLVVAMVQARRRPW